MKYSKRFEDALVFASQLHKEQQRKVSGTPYIGHLLGVASIVIEHGGSEDEAIAALLHDAIEDQGGAKIRDEIRKRFGEKVVEIVDGCTDSDVIPKPPWRKRKEDYIEHLSMATLPILLVSASDKLYNARTIREEYRLIGDEVWNRFQGKKDGTLWYYRALVTAYRNRISKIPNCNPHLSVIVDELDRVVSELEQI